MMIVDILLLWAHTVTDTREPLWKDFFAQEDELEDVPDRFPGYLASLGFVPAVRHQNEGAKPA